MFPQYEFYRINRVLILGRLGKEVLMKDDDDDDAGDAAGDDAGDYVR